MFNQYGVDRRVGQQFQELGPLVIQPGSGFLYDCVKDYSVLAGPSPEPIGLWFQLAFWSALDTLA